MNFAFFSSDRFGASRRHFLPVGRFLVARVSPSGYLGLHLTVGVAVIFVSGWFFTAAAGNVVNNDTTAAFSQRLGASLDLEVAFAPVTTRWETNVFGSSIMIGLATSAVAVFLARRRAWECLAFLIMAIGGGMLLNQFLQLFFSGWHHATLASSTRELLSEHFPASDPMAVTLFYGALVGVGAFAFCKSSQRAMAGLIAALLIFRVCFGLVALGVDSLCGTLGAVAVSMVWLTFCFTAVDTLRRRRWLLSQVEFVASSYLQFFPGPKLVTSREAASKTEDFERSSRACEGRRVNQEDRLQVPSSRPKQRLIHVSCGVVVALVLAAVFMPHFHRSTGLTSLIRFGEQRRDKLAPELAGVPVYLVPHRPGFDGQYYAHMALHPPWMYHDLSDHYDFPAYRLRRIFLPTLAWVIGFGRPQWIVHVYSFFNVLAWLALAWLLTVWLPLRNWTNFARWTGCLLAAGVLESLRGSLTDLPSLLLMLVGMRLWESHRRAGSAALAVAVLTRDTVALSVLGLLWPHRPCVRGFARVALLGGMIVLPTAIWSFYISHYFPTSLSGVEGNFDWPFRALVGTTLDAWQHLRLGIEDNGRYTFRLITSFSFAVQAGVILNGWRRDPRWLGIALPFILLFPFLGEPVLGGPWGLWRAILPVTIAFCFLAPANRWFFPSLAAGSLPSLFAFFRLVF